MLSLMARVYGKIAKKRAQLYKSGFFKAQSLGVPTFSVGNITAGGTGKTPLVAYIARFLAGEGERVGILTRGYGRTNPKNRVLVSDWEKVLVDARTGGDEPLELAKSLTGRAVVIADADRIGAGRWAREKFGITAFVLDDGFQHMRVSRHLNIVTVDATNPFGNEKMLPAGILREPLAGLGRADLIVITRANLSDRVSELSSQISLINPGVRIFVSGNSSGGFRFLGKIGDIPAEQVAEKGLIAFCALGNPDNFFEQLDHEGLKIIRTEKFPDHHYYSQKDIDNLEQIAETAGAESLITTEKDAVKLTDLVFKFPCIVASNKLIFTDEERLREIIRAALINDNPD